MGKIKDIMLVNEDFKSQIVTDLENENKNLKKQIEELKQQLVDSMFKKEITPEEMVCIEQIKVLQSRSNQRELSLDEVKKLDLLVKNLRLIREKSTENVHSPRYRDVTSAEDILVEIATQSPEHES